MMGWGELLRMSQRVAAVDAPVLVRAQVRSQQDAELHFEVCAKQLLYDGGCLTGGAKLPARAGQWQNVSLKLAGAAPSPGDWWASKPIVFSVAVASEQSLLDLRSIALVDGSGRELLANGNFTNGMAQWFFSSDRLHLPWHIKNIFMNVLFDQGVLGLGLFVLLLLAAFWRLTLGRARHAPLAPALAASLAGFIVVGLFDSLLDVPRVAQLFYLLLMISLAVQSPTVEPTIRSVGTRRPLSDG